MRISYTIALIFLSMAHAHAGDTDVLSSTNTADIHVAADYDWLDISRINTVSVSVVAIGSSTSVKIEEQRDPQSTTADSLTVQNTTMNNSNSGTITATGRFYNPKGLKGPGESSLSIIAAGTMATIALK